MVIRRCNDGLPRPHCMISAVNCIAAAHCAAAMQNHPDSMRGSQA
ncbi:hypothetical protein XCR_3552 [Xanthomonas campestris pv. raphani 756C]|nr:hypothetical protein XCR_3552 [Xanthomonas campestris pv. raphani 756C]